jgi:hypothetical protein
VNGQRALKALFDLRPGEGRFVFVLWLAYLVVVLGLRVGWATTTALFLDVVGVRWLPAVLIVRALASLVATTFYAAHADRVRNDRVFLVLLSAGAAAVVLAELVGAASPVLGAVLLYVVARAVGTIFFLHWGVWLSEYFVPADARRLYAGIFSGARLGGVLGGVLLVTLPDVIGMVGLNLVFAATLVAGAAAVHVASGAAFERFRNTPQGPAPARADAARAPSGRFARWPGLANLVDGLRYVRRSRFLLWTAATTVLLVWTRGVLDLVSNTVFEAEFGDARELAQFFGWYAMAAGAVALVLQVGAAGRAIARFGISRPNLAYALTFAGAGLGLTLAPGLPAAVACRFAENELRTAVKVPIHNLLYTAVEPRVRARARATSSGLTVPLATLVINLALLVLQPALPLTALAGLGAALALGHVYTTLRQNREFVRTLAARAAADVVGEESLAPTPTPAAHADGPTAARILADPAAPRAERFQALCAVPAERMDRGLREEVARALAAELRTGARLLALALAAPDRQRARVLEVAADERCRHTLALTGAWAAPRMRFALLGDLRGPGAEDAAARLAPIREVLAELLPPRLVDELGAAAEAYRRARHGPARHDAPAAEQVAAAGDAAARGAAWGDRWVAAGLLLVLPPGAAPAAALAAAGDLATPPSGPEAARGPWQRLPVLERVALLLHYPIFRGVSLPTLESLARSAAGAAVGARLLGAGEKPVAEPDDAALRSVLAAWLAEQDED